MIASKRTILIIALALLIGALAAVVIGVGREGSATGLGSSDSAGQADVLAEDGTTEGEVPAVVDPAKESVTLDKFTVKDPFIPLTQPNTGTGTGGTGSPTSANIKVNGTSYTVEVGDKVASDVFTISAITSSGVTFALAEGREFSDGSTSVSVNVGESVKVTDSDSDKSYTLEVISVGYGDGGNAATGGHTVSLVSVSEQNGVAMATIEVDGTTYADKKEGDTFSTGWGDIKIISINVGAQSVVIQHGDQTLTLYVGSVLTK